MHLVANFPAGYKWAVSYTLWRAYTRHALPFFSLSHNRNRTTITTPLVNDDRCINHPSATASIRRGMAALKRAGYFSSGRLRDPGVLKRTLQ